MKNKFVKWFMKHKLVVVGVLAGVLALGLGVSIYKYHKDMNAMQLQAQQQQEALNSQIAANNRTGYVATTQILQGDILQDGVNVAMQTFASSADQTTFATADCIGKQAVVDIPMGAPVTMNVVATIMPEQMNERECTFINLSANLSKGDFVDVRIMFPNGEDYIVVPKVAIQNPVIASNLVYLWLNENCNELLSAAVVDANLHGAYIYTTKYIEPEIQPANTITYQPNAAVMKVMESDPNIVKESEAALSVTAREGIEDRLKAFEEAYPDFELKLKNNDDVDEALKNMANGSSQQQQQNTQQGTQQQGTQQDAQQGTQQQNTQQQNAQQQQQNNQQQGTQQNATVTYGN